MLKTDEEGMDKKMINVNMETDISKPASTGEGTDGSVFKRLCSKLRKSRMFGPTPARAGAVQTKSFPRWVTVSVGLLCVLMLVLTAGLCVKFTSERDKLQIELDQLQMNYLSVTRERDQLWAISKQLKKPPCPSGWISNCKCYRVWPGPQTWWESRRQCQRMGADLVIINSREEQDCLAKRRLHGWIGLQRKPNGWMWVDNTPISISFWEAGQSFKKDENCALLFPSQYNLITNWHDYPCDSAHPFICEKSVSVAVKE